MESIVILRGMLDMEIRSIASHVLEGLRDLEELLSTGVWDWVRESAFRWVSPRQSSVNSCKQFEYFVLASGFPALGWVFIPSSAGLSGLNKTPKPLICFNPSPTPWGQPGAAKPSSMWVHRGFEGVRCLAGYIFRGW
jgi:hypothetical protein